MFSKISHRSLAQGIGLPAIAALLGGVLTSCTPAADTTPPQLLSEGQFIPSVASTPRLTPDQYRHVIADVFGPTIDLGGRFEPDMRVDGLLAVGSSSISVTPAGMEQYDAMADAIAAQVLLDEKNRRLMVSCTPSSAAKPDDACAATFLSAAGRMLYRRPLDKVELGAYVEAANIAASKVGDFYQGLSMSLSAMLSSPQFLFRVPQVEADPNRPGQYRLDAYSRASRLSFFLWNASPDRQLMDAAENGDLYTQAGLNKQVERMMASPRLEAGVRAYFSDMFHFEEFEALSKDTVLFPMFGKREAAHAQEQTLRTIVELLLTERGDYRDIFTTKKTFLTPALGAIYRVPVVNDRPNGAEEPWQPYEFASDDPRGGILSHISFTALHSPPGRSSPTLRGKALREVMLCQKVPAPPGNVDFTLVNDTTVYRTARERLAAHASEPMCAGCHKITDPMGLALEHFDGAGGYRNTENGAEIDTRGELDSVSFTNAYEMGEAVSKNQAATSCLVNRLTSYAVGKPPGKNEAAWIAKLKEEFALNGYVLPDLMKRIASSAEFYIVEQPAAEEMSASAK